MRAISSFYPEVPQAAIYKFLRKGQIKLNESRTSPDTIIPDKASLYIYIDIRRELIKTVTNKTLLNLPESTPSIKFEILHEDNNFLFINKKAGMVIHTGTGNQEGIIEILQKQKNHQVLPVHRLDKEVSGCLVIAKNSKTAKSFHDLLNNHKVIKIYFVVVEGRYEGSKKIGISIGGKSAITLIESRYFLQKFTVMRVRIITGRKHQIRKHFQIIGHPIVGDLKYGSAYAKHPICLHAASIQFTLMNRIYLVEAPLSVAIRKFLKALNPNLSHRETKKSKK